MPHNRQLLFSYAADKGQELRIRICRHSDRQCADEHAEHILFEPGAPVSVISADGNIFLAVRRLMHMYNEAINRDDADIIFFAKTPDRLF